MELDDAKYLILDDLKTDKNNANGYHREVASYMLFSRNIKFITEDSLTPEDIDNYDYIAVIEYNDYTKSLLKNNHFSDSIDAVGLHKLH